MIWGISDQKNTITAELEEFQCPKCLRIGDVRAIAYCKYLHIIFIPTFSIGKRSKFYCCNCEKKIKKKLIPSYLHPVAEDLKNFVKIPFTHFIGSILLGLFVIMLTIAVIRTPSKPSIEPTAALNSPQVGDIYSVHLSKDDDLYSTWKVINLDEDSVYVFKNQVVIEGNWDFIMEKNEEATQMFLPDTVGIARKNLLRMHANRFITDVDRESFE